MEKNRIKRRRIIENKYQMSKEYLRMKSRFMKIDLWFRIKVPKIRSSMSYAIQYNHINKNKVIRIIQVTR